MSSDVKCKGRWAKDREQWEGHTGAGSSVEGKVHELQLTEDTHQARAYSKMPASSQQLAALRTPEASALGDVP